MLNTILLMSPPGGNSNPLMNLLPWVGIMIVFYFFMIRPQVKRNKEQKQFREALKEGDKVVTVGGIHGKVKEINDTTVVLEVEGGRIRVEKASLSAGGVLELGQKN